MENLHSATLALEVDRNISNVSQLFCENETKYYHEAASVSSVDSTEIANLMVKISYPILVVLGTAGNILSFYVMRRGSLKNVSTCFYMSILTMTDTCFLWSGAFVEWLNLLTNFEVKVDLLADCKVVYFLFFFSAHYSSALLVVMSLEKFFALYYPLKTRSICTVKTARWASLVAGVIMFAYNSQNFFIWEKETHYGISVCIFTHLNYYKMFSKMNSIIWSFLPFAMIFLTNSAICYKFMMARWKSRQSGTQSTTQALSKKAIQGTAMLITVSFVFILFNGPSALLGHIGDGIWTQPIALRVIGIFQYVNYSINAVLYSIVGSRFRKELVNTLCCSRNSNMRSSSSSSSTTSRRGSVF